MSLSPVQIAKLIKQGIPGADVEVEDLRGETGDGTSGHLIAYVTARQFNGKPRVDQHKMVYACLKDHMGDEIDSLAIQTIEI